MHLDILNKAPVSVNLLADRLNRIGNVLIAYARHGERSPIDDDTGQSWIDIRRDQERQRSFRGKP